MKFTMFSKEESSEEESSEEESLTEDPNSRTSVNVYRRFRAGGILPYTIILGEVYILLGRQSRGFFIIISQRSFNIFFKHQKLVRFWRIYF